MLVELGLVAQGHRAVFEILRGSQVTDLGFTGPDPECIVMVWPVMPQPTYRR